MGHKLWPPGTLLALTCSGPALLTLRILPGCVQVLSHKTEVLQSQQGSVQTSPPKGHSGAPGIVGHQWVLVLSPVAFPLPKTF